jgi:hypothetical protein
LLLSRSRDAELDAVGALLARVQIPTARVNADELASADLLIDPGRGAVRLDRRWLTPTVTWIRHFSERAIAGSDRPARDLFLRDSWRTAAAQLAALAPAAIGTRNPGLLEQLRAAEKCQVAVPRTVVATDLAAARDVLGADRRLIVKALDEHFVETDPGWLAGVFPVVTDSPRLPSAPRPGAPVIVQEYVEHDAELRVYYVGGQVHGFAVGKQAAADPWRAPGRVTARETELSAAVDVATRQLAEGLSLHYGAFDFLLRDQTPVFLEANPAGDWLWAERRAGTATVTLACARMLCDLHRLRRKSRTAPGIRTGGRFDLLSFLSPGPAASR